MRCFPGLAFFACVFFALLFHAQDQPLARRISEVLAQPEVARGAWGVDAVSLRTGDTLVAINADKLFTPASTLKLFTTAAGFALLGQDYRFHTTVEAGAPVDKYGRLAGDLALVGRGDPNLSGRALPYHLHTERTPPPIPALEQLADQLVQKGLKFIDGDVVADDSYYLFERYGTGWSQDDLMWESGAPVSALAINDDVIFANILPGDRAGEHAFVSVTPFADYYRLDNRILTTAPDAGPRNLSINREPGSNVLSLWGSIPADDQGVTESLAIDDPAEFAAQLFRSLLEKRGIVVYGHARARHHDLASALTTTTPLACAHGVGSPTASGNCTMILASYDSQPLGEDLQVINKVSQNLHAELLLRLLGREKGSAGAIAAGLEVLRRFLQQAGITGEEYSLHDGSGLSREDLVTPRALVKLLTYARRQPWGQAFENSLPVGGVDGSLGDRFKGGGREKRIHAKTGTLTHVNALSGFATTAAGEPIAFAIVVNNHNLSNQRESHCSSHGCAVDVIDRIVEAMLEE